MKKNKARRTLAALLAAAAALGAFGGTAFAEEQAAEPESAAAVEDQAAEPEGMAVTEAVTAVTLESVNASSDPLSKKIKVNYNSRLFGSGIASFDLYLTISGGSIASVSGESRLGGRLSESRSGNTYVCSMSEGSLMTSADNSLVILTVALNSPLDSDMTVSLADGTQVTGGTAAYRLADGGMAQQSLVFPKAEQYHDLPNGNSGVSGSVSWTFDRAETLTLKMHGNMADYTASDPAPWQNKGDEYIKHIIFDAGDITSVGDYAFAGLKNLEDVTLSSGLITIGNSAFEGCGKLKSIGLADLEKLSGIGMRAFADCSSLSSVTVPKSVAQISRGAFAGCLGLTEITLPFVGSQRGSSDNRDVFKFIFDDSVPSRLAAVNINDETDIPDSAFEGCDKIESISINKEVRTIGRAAFKGCGALKSFVIPDGIDEIKDETFMDCSSITSVTVPDSIVKIGESAFDGCLSLLSIYVPYGVAEIRNKTFRNCGSLTSIEIPDSVKMIYENVLEGCTKLVSIKIPFVGASNSVSVSAVEYDNVFGYLFGTSAIGTAQGRYTFGIPASVTKVEVTNKYGSSAISPGAFMNCANIADIIIYGGKRVCGEAFKNCVNLKNLILPKSVTRIDKDILLGCANLENLTVPFIGSSRSDGGTETSVLGYFFGYNDYNPDRTDVEQYYTESSAHFYHIPETLRSVSVLNQTDIPYGAFMECCYIESVTIETGAKMNDRAFYNCTALTDVRLPGDMREIGYECFAECSNLRNINIPSGAQIIGNYAFYNDKSLATITIPKSVVSIADMVFAGTNYSISSYDGQMGVMSGGGLTIRGVAGSYAQQYANEKGIAFETVSAESFEERTIEPEVHTLSDGISVEVKTENIDKAENVYIALYNGGKFICAKPTAKDNETSPTAAFSSEELKNATTAKIFMWNDRNKPVVPAMTVNNISGRK